MDYVYKEKRNYIGIKPEDKEKVLELLSSSNIDHNFHEDSHSTICREEAVEAVNGMIDNNDYYKIQSIMDIEKDIKLLNELEDNIYNELYTKSEDDDMYNKEYIWNVDEKYIQEFISKIGGDSYNVLS